MSQEGPQMQESPTQRPTTYYDVLDLDRDATPEELKAAYYALARQYHPDVKPGDNENAQRFALINEAYRVLSDQQRRYQYDRTLPKKTYPLRHPTPEKVWREATDVVLIRSDRFGPLNQAMQASVPVVLDSDMLVLTIPGSERHLSGHLETAANRNSILNALELVAGRRIQFRLIDGSTVDDWEMLKAAENRARASSTAATEAAQQSGAAAPARSAAADAPWDELVQRMHRQYQQLTKRQYPQSKARYLREALGWLIRTDEEIRFGGDVNEDAHERALARAIERLASIVELPPVLIAMELESMRRLGEA
ncbi:MAG: DnaJ domain-containing protein [Armatimonadota bacterium]